MPISAIFLKGRNSMFGLRYARSAFVETVFFDGDSERKENASAAFRCAPASASSDRPCRPFRRVTTTTSFAFTSSFLGGNLSLVDRRVDETAAILRVVGFNRYEVVLRLHSTRWRLAEGSASS
jgi:hypothetical protein